MDGRDQTQSRRSAQFDSEIRFFCLFLWANLATVALPNRHLCFMPMPMLCIYIHYPCPCVHATSDTTAQTPAGPSLIGDAMKVGMAI